MSTKRLLPIMLFVGGSLLAANPAEAAESYDNCTDFIDALPATIGTQGVWCLRKDLSTNLTSGAAITIEKNNVTIDCNDFKVGGLAAGTSSTANGISANERQNVTVRNCGLRGFRAGLNISGGAGHLIENNRLDFNLQGGIELVGGASNAVIRNNRIYDTGGIPRDGFIQGIYANAGDSIEIRDNAIGGVMGTPGKHNSVAGIGRRSLGGGGEFISTRIIGNSVSSLLATGNGTARGVYSQEGAGGDSRVTFRDNHVTIGEQQAASTGLNCLHQGVSVRGNTIIGFETGMDVTCRDVGQNDVF